MLLFRSVTPEQLLMSTPVRLPVMSQSCTTQPGPAPFANAIPAVLRLESFQVAGVLPRRVIVKPLISQFAAPEPESVIVALGPPIALHEAT